MQTKQPVFFLCIQPPPLAITGLNHPYTGRTRPVRLTDRHLDYNCTKTLVTQWRPVPLLRRVRHCFMGVVCMCCVMCVICMDKWATALSANRTTDGATLRVSSCQIKNAEVKIPNRRWMYLLRDSFLCSLYYICIWISKKFRSVQYNSTWKHLVYTRNKLIVYNTQKWKKL